MDLRPIHTLPVWKDEPEHDCKETCWCHPVVFEACSQCNTDAFDCWKCGGAGVVPHSGNPKMVKLVVHNALTRAEGAPT